MQPRSLAQILSELDSTYNPQVDSLRQRQAAIPGAVASDEQGLQAKQETAFGDIVNGARRRGMGFSGIPLAEQAKYTATDYLPAVAKLRQSGREQAMSLEDAILGVHERKNTQGQGIYQYEQSLAEQKRQFDETKRMQEASQAAAQRAAAAQASPTFGGMPGGPMGGGKQGSGLTYTQRADKGFNFVNQYGNPISAAQYAAMTGTPFRDLLQIMSRAGDNGAKQALGFVGSDYGYDPKKVNNQNLANLYNSLVWGTGARQASTYSAAAPAKPATGNRAPLYMSAPTTFPMKPNPFGR